MDDRRTSHDSDKKVRIKLKTDPVKQDPRSVKAPKNKSALKKDNENETTSLDSSPPQSSHEGQVSLEKSENLIEEKTLRVTSDAHKTPQPKENAEAKNIEAKAKNINHLKEELKPNKIVQNVSEEKAPPPRLGETIDKQEVNKTDPLMQMNHGADHGELQKPETKSSPEPSKMVAPKHQERKLVNVESESKKEKEQIKENSLEEASSQHVLGEENLSQMLPPSKNKVGSVSGTLETSGNSKQLNEEGEQGKLATEGKLEKPEVSEENKNQTVDESLSKIVPGEDSEGFSDGKAVTLENVPVEDGDGRGQTQNGDAGSKPILGHGETENTGNEPVDEQAEKSDIGSKPMDDSKAVSQEINPGGKGNIIADVEVNYDEATNQSDSRRTNVSIKVRRAVDGEQTGNDAAQQEQTGASVAENMSTQSQLPVSSKTERSDITVTYDSNSIMINAENTIMADNAQNAREADKPSVQTEAFTTGKDTDLRETESHSHIDTINNVNEAQHGDDNLAEDDLKRIKSEKQEEAGSSQTDFERNVNEGQHGHENLAEEALKSNQSEKQEEEGNGEFHKSLRRTTASEDLKIEELKKRVRPGQYFVVKGKSESFDVRSAEKRKVLAYKVGSKNTSRFSTILIETVEELERASVRHPSILSEFKHPTNEARGSLLSAYFAGANVTGSTKHNFQREPGTNAEQDDNAKHKFERNDIDTIQKSSASENNFWAADLSPDQETFGGVSPKQPTEPTIQSSNYNYPFLTDYDVNHERKSNK